MSLPHAAAGWGEIGGEKRYFIVHPGHIYARVNRPDRDRNMEGTRIMRRQRDFLWAACMASAILSSTLISPAMADPTRDQVMDGAARCEGIPDNRVWLDCFYGSAQPMRAQLGLSPAPESQTRLVPAQGASYGGAAYGSAPVARRAAAKPKSEGFWGSLIGNTSPLAHDMPMRTYDFGRNGRFTVTMLDGHVWRQAESDIPIAKWKKSPASYKVTINNGNSADLYDMRVEGVVYKVTKVR